MRLDFKDYEGKSALLAESVRSHLQEVLNGKDSDQFREAGKGFQPEVTSTKDGDYLTPRLDDFRFESEDLV